MTEIHKILESNFKKHKANQGGIYLLPNIGFLLVKELKAAW